MELLVTIAIIGILAALLLPVLSKAKQATLRVNCISNLRQLSMAAKMYGTEHKGNLVPNWPVGAPPDLDCWCPEFSSTNVSALQQGKLWTYIGSAGVYRCPADGRNIGGWPVVRSYSMNAWMNGRSEGDATGKSNYRTPEKDITLTYTLFRKEHQVTQPAKLWEFIDEDESSINDSLFIVDMSENRNGIYDLPSNRHGSSYCITFADGHAELVKMLRSRTEWNSPDNPDWKRLKEMTTVRRQ